MATLKKSGGKGKGGGGSEKLRGLPKDSPAVRLSKTLSWLLRHGAQGEGLKMRADGYVKVTDLLENPKIKSQALDLKGLQEIVEADSKQRYSLICEDGDEWWIKANQGHSIKAVKLELKPVLTAEDIPSRTAVHGTTKKAWQSISSQGLSKMSRNHIHLAQGVSGDNVISGMRKSCEILIFINIPKAISAGTKFFLSDNGVVLTEGNDKGFLEPHFFSSMDGWGTAREEPGSDSKNLQADLAAAAGLVNEANDVVTATSTLLPESADGNLGEVEIQS
ncbi:KptA family-domain-containing protein [Rhodocollybia butyracea]|uniref:2'-phosphotransferase n=1 Tax=Rhodocollybia butyracea TaxID=206335 RepID=A0A9P5QC97_9AGAR|nr:KptA family-domain-containing protein [Rhodocollybia butyracea]